MNRVDKQEDLKLGFICPKCDSFTSRFRHPFSKVWCKSCGHVLKHEGDMTPYNYEEHK